MAIKITYAHGKTEIITGVVNVDYNFQEGTYDFCDVKGRPMKQLVLETGVTWAYVKDYEKPESYKAETPN